MGRGGYHRCKGRVYCRYCRYFVGGLTCMMYPLECTDNWYNTGSTHEHYVVANKDNNCARFRQLNRLAFFLRRLIDEDY